MKSWDDVRLLLAVSRGGSLARAAQALGVDHTTIGRRLSAFERELGVRLFERRRTGVALTRKGDELCALAAQVEAAMLALERVGASLDTGLSGEVRIATSSILATGLLAPRLPGFAARHPQITLELRVARALVSLGRGEADLALRLRPKGAYVAEASTVGSTLATIGWAAYRARAPHRPARIAYPQPGASPGLAWLERHLTAPTLLVDDVLSALALACAGAGTAVLPSFLAESRPELERVSERLEEHRLIVVATREARRVARVGAVIAWLRSLAEAQKATLAGPPAARGRPQ